MDFTQWPNVSSVLTKESLNYQALWKAPSFSAEIIGQYTIGESFHYDSYTVSENFIWLSYISYSGERRYVAWRVQNGEKFGYIE